jgi:hypothetical protein
MEAVRLEAAASEQMLDPYRSFYWGQKLRLALARNEMHEVERLVDDFESGPRTRVDSVAALLDALVVLGARERIEVEAPKFLTPGTYVEPFALRALGFARNDHQLVADALRRFRAIGLDWHAEQTQALLQ